MVNLTYELGYEGRTVINPESVNLEELKTDYDFITVYGELTKAVHFQDSSKNDHGKKAWELEQKIVDDVRNRLEKAGWHVHIFKTGSIHQSDGMRETCHFEPYLHQFVSRVPQISEVPFSSERNISFTEAELFNDDGSLRSMSETMELLEERIGENALNLDEMVENGDIEEDTAKIVKEIMDDENLTIVHELDEDDRTFRSGDKEFTWRDNEDEAKDEARESIEDDDGYQWREAVQAQRTELSREEWEDLVIDEDWQGMIASYDGCVNNLSSGAVYWRIN